MHKIREFLKADYKNKVLKVQKDCIAPERLCSYLEGGMPLHIREDVEAHLASCYQCLDALVAITEGGGMRNNKRRFKLKKEMLFLFLAVLCFVMSFAFGRYFLQFLTATLILGMKWVVDSKTSRMLIMVYDAWKRGGDREAGRILKEINTERR